MYSYKVRGSPTIYEYEDFRSAHLIFYVLARTTKYRYFLVPPMRYSSIIICPWHRILRGAVLKTSPPASHRRPPAATPGTPNQLQAPLACPSSSCHGQMPQDGEGGLGFERARQGSLQSMSGSCRKQKDPVREFFVYVHSCTVTSLFFSPSHS